MLYKYERKAEERICTLERKATRKRSNAKQRNTMGNACSKAEGNAKEEQREAEEHNGECVL
jgi:hypothetical protein